MKNNNVDFSNLNEDVFLIEVDGLIDRIKINNNQITLDNKNYEDQLYNEEIALLTSKLSQYHFVREFINDILLNLAKVNNIIVDGRDMGSVVFKDADLKFYLDASNTIRAHRRYLQLKQINPNINEIDILNDINKRDEQDKTRKLSPLIIPENAIVIQTDSYSIDEVVNMMFLQFKKRIKKIQE
ncbi:MAG: (d)CMP kinase [Mycoplasmataceae bacterium]|nr:(d)CMP kinase [Mycoplasmataceae bacterium]